MQTIELGMTPDDKFHRSETAPRISSPRVSIALSLQAIWEALAKGDDTLKSARLASAVFNPDELPLTNSRRTLNISAHPAEVDEPWRAPGE